VAAFYAFVLAPASAAPHGTWRALLEFHARVVGFFLNLVGSHVRVEGTYIMSNSPQFTLQIIRGCDAIEPIAIFLAAVLVSPVRITSRLVGAIAGSLILILVNWFRLVMLFFVGMYWRSLFDLLHETIWQAIFVALAIVLWALWVDWATRTKPKPQNSGAPNDSA